MGRLFTTTVILSILICCQKLNAQLRKELLLDKNWKFIKGEQPDAHSVGFNDASWSTISIPHDWAIQGPFDGANDRQKVKVEQNGEKLATVKSGRTGGLPFIGTGWYRLKFKVPDYIKGSNASIIFDGAMSNAQVFLNGKEVGRWAYGYNSFHINISEYLKVDGEENVLAVRLENLPESSRWYPGAGIYRNVHLVITRDIHIPVWGTYITTPVVKQDFANVSIQTKINQSSFEPITLKTSILNANGQVVGEKTAQLQRNDQNCYSQNINVQNPRLWSPETPYLYTAVSKLYRGDEQVDEYQTRFGIRTIKLVADSGFFLNGKIRKFQGVCNHHDLGSLGAAVNKSALRRQLVMLKDMGCDAIRTSHNMPAPELVDLCDEMGFMMIVEAFDEWKTPKVKNGYSRLFDQWAEKDIINMIHRDRNHPSVVMWSIGNEVPDQTVSGGNKIAKWLQDICHREDPTRPVTAAMDQIDAALNNNFASVLDVAGFNYKTYRYEEANSRLPQGFILGSETASTVSSRGKYKFPATLLKHKTYEDNQSSSYDLEACHWSQIPDEEFSKQDDLPYVVGEFVWTGFDYLGEPTPYDSAWPSHSSYFGIIDLAGIPKDRFYLYRSKWNTTENTLHILPHWTWPGREGEITPVFCYTNYPSAELFVNGKSMGKKFKDKNSFRDRYRLTWDNVKYEPGEICIVAYGYNGEELNRKKVKTAGVPHHVSLDVDRNEIEADGKDLAFVTARICDIEGNLCPDASIQLHFTVNGAGNFKSIANGDATSLEPFHLPQMKTFSGMLVGTVQSKALNGKLTVVVAAKGLKPGKIVINTRHNIKF